MLAETMTPEAFARGGKLAMTAPTYVDGREKWPFSPGGGVVDT
jgi:hypothetical protein